jgi:DNA-binding LacI/PurR family transcriptional regulator
MKAVRSADFRGRARFVLGILTTPQKDIFHSGYHLGLLSGILPRVKALGGRLEIVMMPPRPCRNLDEILTRHNLDGLMILTWRWIHPSVARLIETQKHPRVLVVNDPLPGLKVNHVYTDAVHGTRLAVDRLVGKGIRGIGMVHGPLAVSFRTGDRVRKSPFIDTILKRNAFLKALKARKVPAEKKWIRAAAANSEAEGYRVMKTWVRERELPAAIVCGNDDLAFGVIRALKAAGLRCPGDILVTGFDDNGKAAGFRPPLTTIRQPLQRMGKDAVDILFRQIRKPGRAVAKKYPPKLIVRKSA